MLRWIGLTKTDIEALDHARFGKVLKQLRNAKGWSLADAAEATKRVGTSKESHVSNPYLSQLERGGKFKLSFAKLSSLAAAYGVPISWLIQESPMHMQARLRDDYKEARIAGNIPAPHERYHKNKSAVDNDIQQALESTVDSRMRVPVKRENHAREQIRYFAGFVALPAFTWRLGTEFIQSFARSREIMLAAISEAWETDIEYWGAVCVEFLDFIVYEKGEIESLFGRIDYWSIDFDENQCCCRFRDDEETEFFGFRHLPYSFATENAMMMTATMLCAPMSKWIAEAPGAPDPVEQASFSYLQTYSPERFEHSGERISSSASAAAHAAIDMAAILGKPELGEFDKRTHAETMSLLKRQVRFMLARE